MTQENNNELYVAALGVAGAALSALLGHMKGRSREKVDVGLAQAKLATFITEQNQKCQEDLADLRRLVEERTEERQAEHSKLNGEIDALRQRLARCEKHWTWTGEERRTQ